MACAGKRVRLFRNRVGFSANFSDALLSTLEDSHNNYNRTCQFYLGGKAGPVWQLMIGDIIASRDFMEKKLMTFHIHSPININLSAIKPNVASASVKSLNNILTQISDLNATCIVHCGAIGEPQRVVDNINRLTTVGCLLLENSAGAGTQHGSTIDEMKFFINNISRPNTGICIDTQHAFAAGVTKWDSYDESIKILNVYNSLGKIKLIHLNDSKVDFGSKIDSHQIIGQGFIWSDPHKYLGLMGILAWCDVNNVDIVEETSDSTTSISFLRSIRNTYS